MESCTPTFAVKKGLKLTRLSRLQNLNRYGMQVEELERKVEQLQKDGQLKGCRIENLQSANQKVKQALQEAKQTVRHYINKVKHGRLS